MDTASVNLCSAASGLGDFVSPTTLARLALTCHFYHTRIPRRKVESVLVTSDDLNSQFSVHFTAGQCSWNRSYPVEDGSCLNDGVFQCDTLCLSGMTSDLVDRIPAAAVQNVRNFLSGQAYRGIAAFLHPWLAWVIIGAWSPPSIRNQVSLRAVLHRLEQVVLLEFYPRAFADSHHWHLTIADWLHSRAERLRCLKLIFEAERDLPLHTEHFVDLWSTSTHMNRLEVTVHWTTACEAAHATCALLTAAFERHLRMRAVKIDQHTTSIQLFDRKIVIKANKMLT